MKNQSTIDGESHKKSIKQMYNERNSIIEELTNTTDFDKAEKLRRDYDNISIRIEAEKKILKKEWNGAKKTHAIIKPDLRKNRMRM